MTKKKPQAPQAPPPSDAKAVLSPTEGIVAGVAGALFLDRLLPVIQRAVRFSLERHPEGSDEQLAFANGAIYGVVAQYIAEHAPDSDDDDARRAFAVTVIAMEESADGFDCDLDSYAQALLAARVEEVAHV